MKTRLVAAAAILVITTSWVFASEVEKFPPDITWAARLDVQGVMASDWGPKMREGAAKPDAAAKLNAARVLLGVDLLNDIHAIAISGRAQIKTSVTIYVRGTLDSEPLLALAAISKDYRVATYGSYEIHSWENAGGMGRAYGTFARQDLLVIAASQERMRAALGALDGTGESARADLVNALSIEGDFLSAIALGVNAMPAIRAQTAVLENVKDLEASLGATGGMLRLSLAAVTEDVQTAERIRDVLSGLRALVLLDASKHPAAAMLSQRAVIDQEGTRIRITLSATEEELKRLERKGRGNGPSPL